MSDARTPARQLLDTLREQGAERLDPVRFHAMEALERRAAMHEGEARHLLDARLSALLAAYADQVKREAARDLRTENARDHGPLVSLVAAMGNGDAANYPELPMLGDFRQLWSRLRTESQLRQSLQPAPANAGPLNSSALAHRSIALMRESSPGYLQHFLGYLDALSWMEQLSGSSTLPLREAPAAAASRKRARSRTRTRDE